MPLERKMDAQILGEKEIIFNYFPRILIYLKRNNFNSHYYYTFDILITLMTLMVYLAE